MITRRAFFRNAILSAGALPGWAPSLTLEPPAKLRVGEKLRVHDVIFDARHSHALEFAETARRMGASTRAIYGDVCDRCFEDVYARWRAATAAPAGITDLAGKTGLAGKTALAGITDFRSLFFLQAMAADTGLRTVLRIHHHFNTAAHEAFGARAFRALSDERLGCSGERWASEAARLVLSLPSAADGTAQRNSNLGEANQRALGSRALVSWVMAET